MPSRKAIILFFILVAIIYGVLLIPWPGLLSGYRAAFSGAGNIFFHRMGQARVKFEPMAAPTLEKDTEVNMQNTTTGRAGKIMLNARRQYLPTAFTAALVLAAPIAWRRKLLSLCMGLVLISAYVGFGVWLQLMFALSDPPPGFDAVSVGPGMRRVVAILIAILTKSPVTPYIAALLVFVVATLRREDIVRLGGVVTTRTGAGHKTAPA